MLDGETAEHGGADALERVVRNAGRGDPGDLGEQFAAGQRRLLGSGGEEEGEESGVVAEELGGAYLIGQAELLADAAEQGAGHVRGVFLDHRQRMPVRTADGGAGEADGEHGLFFRQAHGEVTTAIARAGGSLPQGGRGHF